MSSSTKDEYLEFSKGSYLPVFVQPWWLDAVCGTEDWDVLIYKKGTAIVGVWPHYKVVRARKVFWTMPPLTKFLGVYLSHPPNQNDNKRQSFEKEVITGLATQISSPFIQQNFHYTFGSWLPLLWNGFSQTTGYSYEIKADSYDDALKAFKPSTRRDIKKAASILKVEESNDINPLYRLVVEIFEKKNKKAPYPQALLKKLDTTCRQHSAAKLLYAKDAHGHIHAGIYLVWDTERCYYLISGSDPQHLGSNANTLLLSYAIEDALSRGLIFDFEGSMIESIESYFRSFGAIQRPYHRISRIKGLFFRIFFMLKSLVG